MFVQHPRTTLHGFSIVLVHHLRFFRAAREMNAVLVDKFRLRDTTKRKVHPILDALLWDELHALAHLLVGS